MKKIILDDNYSMACDTDTCTLYYKKVGEINPDTGKPIVSSNQWYYPNMKVCLKFYLLKSAAESTSISGVLDRINEIENKIDNLCKNLKQ